MRGVMRLKQRSRLSILLLSVILLSGMIIAVQATSAYQNDNKPVPPSSSRGVPSPYTDDVPTTDELLATPASIERYVTANTLPAGIFSPADLTTSTKTASRDSVAPGGVFNYMVEINNTGDFDIPVEMTDPLPDELDFIDVDCQAFISDRCEFLAGAVIWQGTVPQDGNVVITITVRLGGEVEPGDVITNTAQITSAEGSVDVSDDVTVADFASSPTQFLPYTTYGILPLTPLNISATRVTSNNTWTINWTATNEMGATGYEIHKASKADFSDAVPTVVGIGQTSLAESATPSPNNVHYYRVRSLRGMEFGPWSNVVEVISGYRDDFDDPSTGWSLRRSTYREKVFGFYEDGKFVIQVLDRWDWGIASPLKPAPRVPYAIDFEARIVAPANLLSFGYVFGGDWNGENCPPGIEFDQWYKHTNCFNHFYNGNTIFFGPLKLLFERVDSLVWCLECGGSPMKRLGDIDSNRTKTYQGVDPLSWNRYRIEVREDSIKIFAGERGKELQSQYEYNDTRWIGSPYFGVFASTDEYNNSTWRVEYYEVMPID